MLGVLVGINDKRGKRGAEEMGDGRTSTWELGKGGGAIQGGDEEMEI